MNSCCHAVAEGQAAGRCSVVRRAEVATRAAMLISWVRMVAVVPLACTAEELPAARRRLNAIAASTSQAELAANRRVGGPAARLSGQR